MSKPNQKAKWKLFLNSKLSYSYITKLHMWSSNREVRGNLEGKAPLFDLSYPIKPIKCIIKFEWKQNGTIKHKTCQSMSKLYIKTK